MARRRAAEKRDILPDARYNEIMVARFINMVMRCGKKAVSERIVYGAFERVAERTGEEPVKVFRAAVENVRPEREVRRRRVGGATYQIPVEVRAQRGATLAYRWLIHFARRRSEKTMIERLSAELLEASNNRGGAVRRRDEAHKTAEANRAFSHYRW